MIMPIIPIYQIVLIYLFSAFSSYDKEKRRLALLYFWLSQEFIYLVFSFYITLLILAMTKLSK